MISWIAGWVGRFRGLVTDAVIDLVHWAVHALASVIETIFSDVARAWHDLWAGMVALEKACFDLGAAVYGLAVRVLKYWVPRIWRYITEAAAALGRSIAWTWHHAVSLVNELRALAWKWILDLWRTVLRDVWKPLKAFADTIWRDLLKWGFTAWWWITHLPQLADAMILHIAAAMERHAWQLAGMLGKFFSSLILHNVKRVAILAEDILTAVI